MEYLYVVAYSYEGGFSSTDITLDRPITDYSQIKEIQYVINKKKNVHSTVLDYRLVAEIPEEKEETKPVDPLYKIKEMQKCVKRWNILQKSIDKKVKL